MKTITKLFVFSVSILMITSVFGPAMLAKYTLETTENNSNNFFDKATNDKDIIERFNSLKYFKTVVGDWADDGVRFSLGNIAFMNDKIVYNFVEKMEQQSLEPEIDNCVMKKGVIVDVSFLGANDVMSIGKGELPHNSNYFIGNDPSKWHKDVKNYERIVYPNIYDNIDLEYYLVGGCLEYDFIVHPGGDPSEIRMQYQGMESLEIEESGILTVQTRYGSFQETSPFIYQGDKSDIVNGGFSIQSNIISFQICDYDRTSILVIDPLVSSTYLGGSNQDWGYGIALDSMDRPVITGHSSLSGFPTTGGAYQTLNAGGMDVFVSILSSDLSTLVSSTYLGGANNDQGLGIVLDSLDRPVITGSALSSDYPTTGGAYQTSNAGQQDVFVSILSSDLSTLVSSTYLGGLDPDYGRSIVLDSANRPVITGYSESADFPTTGDSYQPIFGGAYDAFVTILSPDLTTLVNSTFLGGTSWDEGNGIVLDSNDRPVVTGYAISSDFPITGDANQTLNAGGRDVFVSRLSADLTTLINSTYLGGLGDDRGEGIALDSTGRPFITGYSWSVDFPTTDGAYQTEGSFSSFVSILSSDLTTLDKSSFLGGSGSDYGGSIVLDSTDRPFITGYTSSTDFPMTGDAYQSAHGGGIYDVFMSVMSSDLGTLHYSTYLGGSGDWDEGKDIVLDSIGRPIITGYTSSADFPVTSGAYQENNAGSDEVFISIFDINGGPMVLNSYVDPNPTNGASITTLYANLYDIDNITGVEYFIDATGDNGTGNAMEPFDGDFNSEVETAYSVLNINALGWLPGDIHILYVHGLDESSEWGAFDEVVIYVGTQYFLHVESSLGTNMTLQKIEPDQALIITNTTGPMNSAGHYRVGTEAWITDIFAADTDIGGTWRYFMNGYLTQPATGRLYVKAFEHSTMTLLNPTPEECSVDISNKFSYYEFNWTEEMPASSISAGDRIYLEIWVNTTTGGAILTNDTTVGNVLKYGLVSGAVGDTRTSNNVYQSITEELFNQGGSPNDDYDHLESGWRFDVTGGTSVTFYLEAYHSDSSGIEDFIFAYSTDMVAYVDMVTVTKTVDDDTYQTYVMLPSTSGTIYVMVRDSVYDPGTNEVQDTIYVDHIFVSSLQPPPEFIIGYDNDSTPSRLIVPEQTVGIPITFEIPVSEGWNFISTPLIPVDTTVPNVLMDLDGDTTWTRLLYYDSSDPENHWKGYNPAYLGTQGLANVDVKMGVWLFITGGAAGDGFINVSGVEPSSSTIDLVAGWNLVGYPSSTPRTADSTLPAQVTKMAYYNDTAPYMIIDTSDLSSVTMSDGNAYWVYSTSNVPWTVNW